MAERPCVLVHGSWHGGWHWEEVAARLRSVGLRVFVPTLTGLAERGHEAAADTDLSVHVRDVVSVIDDNDLKDVLLVGHSYGGMVITGAANARPSRIGKLVYLDAFVPRHGESAATILGEDFVRMAEAAAAQAGTPHLIPPLFTVEDSLGWTGELGAAFAARMCPHPAATLHEPVRADGELTAEQIFIRCNEHPLGLFDGYAAMARDSADWRYFELASRHDAVHLMPAAVAGILESLGEQE
ncbi:alpha/beta hydrolase [Spirillospora sp. NPDC048819]|uniref:alpha/beta hydrolase n=1 Tax=Spirillospora sp. NPDC048819 TaxID=3155268 RepID=UPI00340D4135